MNHNIATDKKEIAYINKRKKKAFRESLLFYFFRIFPINKKLISVCTFEGKGGFCCNPKYIVKEIHKKHPEFKFVWFVNSDVLDQKVFPAYIKKVSNTLWNRAFYLSVSKVWIDNYRKPYGTVKRKRQYYLNTWHGAIYIKPIGLWRGDAFSEMAYIVSANDSKMIDDMLIDSDWCKKTASKGFLYEGNCLKYGMPRYDVICGNKMHQRKHVRDMYHLEENSNILLYAPTFREKSVNGVRSVHGDVWSINFSSVIESLEEKFGGKWYVCVRVHPQLSAKFSLDNLQKNDRFIDGNLIEDMYELLSGMDAYISDYSSAAFEAAYANIPVFIYADDIEDYSQDRGRLMWNLTGRKPDYKSIVNGIDADFPFEVASNTNQLVQNIRHFDFEKYISTIGDFQKKIGLVFDGKASERVAKIICEKMGEK